MTLYFGNSDDDRCYDIYHFRDMMSDNDMSEMQVYKAKMIKGEGVFYCSENDFCCVVGESECGKDCDAYTPRNGKNGRCRFSHNCYEPGEATTIYRRKK